MVRGEFMTVPVPTKEELELVRDYILMPLMLTTIQNNSGKIHYSGLPLKDFYLECDKALMAAIFKDLDEVKKKLKAAQIKVEEIDGERAALHYKLYCRGYEETFYIMKEFAKSEISERLGNYIAKMF